jgi:signal transduction histidine kinase
MYFAASLLLMTLVSGTLFQALFTNHTMQTKKEEMLRQAQTLAESLSSVMGDMKMGGQGAGYGALVRAMALIEPNVWILDEQLNFLAAGHMSATMLQYADLPEDADTLVQAVFAGRTPFSEGFSDLLGLPTLTVGVPIWQGSVVAGALLLHDGVAGIQEASAQGVRLMALSGLAALLVATLLATALSNRFAKPLNRMQQTAQRLTEGDYQAVTGIRQNDEIGKLATAMDQLSQRLFDAKTEADQQEQLRRDFLANVSHELRTPVTVLRGSLEALCDGVAQPGPQTAAYHSQMLRETIALQRLVNDLLDLSRLQNPAFPIENTTVNLQDALTDVLYSAGQLARPRGIRIERHIPAEPVFLQGDYGRLRQMFMIVLDNAVKFSPMDGEITVMLTSRSVSIADQGPGISPEDLPHIFDRFYKLNNEANRQGSGLGLAIAREIANRHGMHVEVDSEPGQGATFHFIWAAAV